MERTGHFHLTELKTRSSYNQIIYGNGESEGRPLAWHVRHARSQDIDVGRIARLCDRTTDSAIVRRSAARRRGLSLPGSAAARTEWLGRGRVGPFGQQPARSFL